MSGHNPAVIRCHDDPPLFVEAIRFTAAETGFAARLIEKDYFCSLVLEYLAAADDALVFKGGTCLAKVHAGFYRLSEDLDFAIPMPIEATRQDRSHRAAGTKQAVAELPRALAGMRVVESLRGANNSLQYIGSVAYRSLLSHQQETITIEVGLREPLVMAPELGLVRSILLDPISRQPMISPIRVRCFSLKEAFAEKFRAALKWVPDTFWLVSDGFCERLISLLGRYTSARATRMSTRSANHTGCPDGGDGFRSHLPDGPTAKNWNRPCGKSTG